MDRHYYKHRLHELITKGSQNLKQNHRKENNAQEMSCSFKPTGKTTVRQWKIPQRKQKIHESDNKRIRRTKNRNTHSDHQHLENGITTPKVSSAIKSLKLGKAPGPEGIQNEFIKNYGNKLVHWLNEFLNICYRHIRIPKQRCHANVVGLFKPGKPEISPRSYRPISLLCTTYKLLERILLP